MLLASRGKHRNKVIGRYQKELLLLCQGLDQNTNLMLFFIWIGRAETNG